MSAFPHTFFSLGKQLFKSTEIYAYQNVESTQKYTAAPNGGPLAVLTNTSVNPKDEANTCLFQIYCSGILFRSIHIKSNEDILDFGWHSLEYLMIVTRQATLFVVDLQGKVSMFKLSNYVSVTELSSCIFWKDGIVACSVDNKFIVVENIRLLEQSVADTDNDILVYELPWSLNTIHNSMQSIICYSTLPPAELDVSALKVVISLEGGTLIIADRYFANTLDLQALGITESIKFISVASNNQFVSCYMNNGFEGIVIVCTPDFEKKILEVKLPHDILPFQMVWSGGDAVVLHHPSVGVTLVGPLGDVKLLSYHDCIAMVNEIDGFRIYLKDKCLLIHRETISLSNVLSRKGTNFQPLLLLYEAYLKFECGDPICEDMMKHIISQEQLEKLISECLAMSLYEYNTDIQKRLLRAANYGRSFQTGLLTFESVDTMSHIRILNNLRSPRIGIFLTYSEYKVNSIELLLMRLARRHQFALAINISSLIGCSIENVLIYWSIEKLNALIQTNMTEDSMINILLVKLRPYLGSISLDKLIHYADIKLKRRKFALHLLQYEADIASKIKWYLELSEWKLALETALFLGDINILNDTVITMERMNPFVFTELVHLKTFEIQQILLAISLSCHMSSSNIIDIFKSNAFNTELSVPYMLKMLKTIETNCNEVPLHIQYLKDFKQIIPYHSKESTLINHAVDENVALLSYQQLLEATTNLHFIGLTITQTLYKCILQQTTAPNMQYIDWNQAVAKFIKQFKIAESTVCRLRLECYCRCGKFDFVRALSQERKPPPIGYRPFALACIDYGRSFEEIEFYVDKIVALSEKYALYVDLGKWRRAAEVAALARDPDKLREVAALSEDDLELQTKITDIISKL